MYSEMVEKVKKDISTVKYFAATTDLSTSTANHSYLSCTIHFINEMWEVKSYCLDTVSLFADHVVATNLPGSSERTSCSISDNLIPVCTETRQGTKSDYKMS